MPWLRIDDTAQDDPKVLRCGFEVFGFVALCAAWAAGKVGKIDDGFVPQTMAMRIAGPRWEEMSKAAIKAGLFSKPCRSSFGDRGWLIDQSDELLHMRTWLEVKTDREKDKATRQSGPVTDVRLRDGDQCRYCARTVNWNDRRGVRGGTYDHPDPTDRDVFVVCCGGCNRSKKQKTIDEWIAAGGHPLLPPPNRPLIGPITADQFGVPVTDPTIPARTTEADPQPPSASPQGAAADPARTAPMETQPPAARAPQGDAAAPAVGPGRPGPDLDLSGRESQTCRSRDGSGTGRVVVGTGGSGSSPPPTPARKRGSRGNRSKPTPPTERPGHA